MGSKGQIALKSIRNGRGFPTTWTIILDSSVIILIVLLEVEDPGQGPEDPRVFPVLEELRTLTYLREAKRRSQLSSVLLSHSSGRVPEVGNVKGIFSPSGHLCHVKTSPKWGLFVSPFFVF